MAADTSLMAEGACISARSVASVASRRRVGLSAGGVGAREGAVDPAPCSTPGAKGGAVMHSGGAVT